MKDWWMKNGEIFDTDARGELVVNNSVEDRSDDASDCYFKGFHRVVGLNQILTVVNIALSLNDKCSPLDSAGLAFRMTTFEPPTPSPNGLCHERASGIAPMYVNWLFLDTFTECLRAGFVVGK